MEELLGKLAERQVTSVQIERGVEPCPCDCPNGPCGWQHNRLTGAETWTIQVTRK